MRKILMLVCAFALVCLSCEQENNTQNTQEFELKKDIKFDELTNSQIGFEKNGEIELVVSDEKIMTTFQNFVFKSRLGLEPQSFEIIKVDNISYLRFYSKNHKASTIALIKEDNNQYRTGSTICTSSACSNCCGCLPEGDYCTECRPYGPNNPQKGDCVRSSGGPVIGT